MIYDILPVNNYQGNGASTVFDFDFYIDNSSQLKVYLYDSDGVKYLLENEIDYIIEGEKNPNGGYITFPIEDSKYSILTDNQKISLELDIPASQETQYNNSSLLNLESLEYSFDYLTRLIQILKRKLSLCVKVEECSNNTPEELIRLIGEANTNTSLNANEAKMHQELAKVSADNAKVLKDEIDQTTKKIYSFYDELISNGMFKFNLFDVKISDHILEGNESKGWALQGTYVDESLYPDFYQRCLDEKNSAIETETTLGELSLTMFVNNNGHQFYDISDKEIVDNFYEAYGIADFYGIDEENERIFLPRNKYFQQLTDDVSKVNEMVEAGLPNIKSNRFWAEVTASSNSIEGPFGFYKIDNGSSATTGAHSDGIDFDASRCSAVYGKSDIVQPPSSLKLLYYCVGNTVVNQAEIDAGSLVAQIEQKANIFLDNVSPTSEVQQKIVSWSKPSDKYIDLEYGASGTIYTAPANGYFAILIRLASSGGNTYLNLIDDQDEIILGVGMQQSTSATPTQSFILPVAKNQRMRLQHGANNSVEYFRFVYDQSSESEA